MTSSIYMIQFYCICKWVMCYKARRKTENGKATEAKCIKEDRYIDDPVGPFRIYGMCPL